jgi:hypothetical protein
VISLTPRGTLANARLTPPLYDGLHKPTEGRLTTERASPRKKKGDGEVNEVTLRRRIVALVVAALLSVAGASVIATIVADEAQALQGTNQMDRIFGLGLVGTDKDDVQALRVNDGDAMDG